VAERAGGDVYRDGSYLADNPTWHEEDSAWKAAHIHALLERHSLSPRDIAEVGCGGGLILVELSRAFPQADLTGYEISPQAFARCVSRASPRVRFRHEDLLATDDRHELLLAMDVVEHVDDYVGFLRGLRRHGERFVIQIPLDLSVQTVLRASPILHTRRKVGHLHYFSKETALETLRYAGLEVLDWRYTHAAIHAPGRSRKSRLVGWLRALALKIHADMAVRLLGGSSILVLCR
jgi:trans-aconitate methyltransferase